MRKLTMVVLYVCFAMSICSAQIGGGGTTNYVPIWTSPTTLGNSSIYQDGTGGVRVKAEVHAWDYDIGDFRVVGMFDFGESGNLYLGKNAGYNNRDNSSFGKFDTDTGSFAGFSSAAGSADSFFGYYAGYSNCRSPGRFLCNNNTFIGAFAGRDSDKAEANTYVGANAGVNSANPVTSGTNNILIGYGAGSNLVSNAANPSSNLIYIGAFGTGIAETGAIRIGDPSVSTAAYIQGIYNATSPDGVPVYVSPTGALGTMTSALRFKEQVHDMGDSTDALMKLRPVTFVYKSEYANGERILQYGLIAEEVAKVYPELVAYDKDGRPYSVRYQYLSTMLLNEVQKQYRRAEEQATVIRSQEQKIGELEQRLLRLESLVETEGQLVSQK